jgi:hypothetical protein
MKRYALFCYDAYYPGGGWGDFVNSFDTVDEAMSEPGNKDWDYAEVIDLTTGEDVTPHTLG